MTEAAGPVNTCTPKRKLVQFLSGALEKSSCLQKPEKVELLKASTNICTVSTVSRGAFWILSWQVLL